MLENPETTANQLTIFIKETFAKVGFSHAVIGLSGGVDSAVSCALSVRALGPENVFPVLLPCGDLNTQGLIDAKLVIANLNIPLENIVEIDIAPAVDEIIKTDPATDRVRRGNIMARVRMIYLFDQAKKRKTLVVGTENKTEHFLGYFTRFGDEASDIEPLRNLYKTQVYQLARHLGLPEAVLIKAPTAGLWEGQTDEGEFGFNYKEADQVLSLLYDEKKSVEKVVATGFNEELVQKVVKRVKENEFKHNLPILLY